MRKAESSNVRNTRCCLGVGKSLFFVFLERLGFKRSLGCQNAFYHKARAIRLIVHGDDFLTGGPEKEVLKLKEQMSNKYEAKHQVLGPGKDHLKEMKVLNREIVWHKNKITMESDRKHVKAVIEELGLQHANTVNTPGVKDRYEKVQQEKERQAEQACEEEIDDDES